MLQITCPHCAQPLQIPEQYAGRGGQCRKCGGSFVVPPLASPLDISTKPQHAPMGDPQAAPDRTMNLAPGTTPILWMLLAVGIGSILLHAFRAATSSPSVTIFMFIVLFETLAFLAGEGFLAVLLWRNNRTQCERWRVWVPLAGLVLNLIDVSAQVQHVVGSAPLFSPSWRFMLFRFPGQLLLLSGIYLISEHGTNTFGRLSSRLLFSICLLCYAIQAIITVSLWNVPDFREPLYLASMSLIFAILWSASIIPALRKTRANSLTILIAGATGLVMLMVSLAEMVQSQISPPNLFYTNAIFICLTFFPYYSMQWLLALLYSEHERFAERMPQ